MFFLSVDILTVDILTYVAKTVDILTVDILTVDIFTGYRYWDILEQSNHLNRNTSKGNMETNANWVALDSGGCVTGSINVLATNLPHESRRNVLI